MTPIRLCAVVMLAVACSGANEGEGPPDAAVPSIDAASGPDAPPPPPVVLNEVFAGGNPSHPAGYIYDWIEVKNLDTSPVDLSGWHLSDDPALLGKGTFPAGSQVAVGGYLVVNLSTGAGNFEFGLKQDGSEPIILADPALRVVDQTIFPAAGAGADPPATPASWARIPDGTGPFGTDDSPTPGAPNTL